MRTIKDIFQRKGQKSGKVFTTQPSAHPKTGTLKSSRTAKPAIKIVGDLKPIKITAAVLDPQKSSSLDADLRVALAEGPRGTPNVQIVGHKTLAAEKRPQYNRGTSVVPLCCPNPFRQEASASSNSVARGICPFQSCMRKPAGCAKGQFVCSNLDPFALPIQGNSGKIRLSVPPTTAEILLIGERGELESMISQVRANVERCLESIEVSKALYVTHQVQLDSMQYKAGEELETGRSSHVATELYAPEIVT